MQYLRLIKSTLVDSWAVLVRNSDIQRIAVIDFVMQCASFALWELYLIYTAIRCTTLLVQYLAASFTLSYEQKHKTWRAAQVYGCTKVTGILVSQLVLLVLGLSNPIWSLVVYAWGGFLLCLSTLAYCQSRKYLKLIH